MLLFYLATIIVLFGLGVVGWLLFTEKKKSLEILEDAGPIKKDETAAQLLNRLELHQKPPGAQPQEEKGIAAVFSRLLTSRGRPSLLGKKPALNPPRAAEGTASIRTTPPGPEPMSIEPKEKKWPAHVEATLELSELKQKHQRVETLLNEKLEALEKSEKNLEIEVRNRKEFNKVKDILEKEIKDNKTKVKDLQGELANTQAETGGFKTRVNQLEQKVTKLEKNILELEHTVQDKDVKIKDLEAKLKKAETAVPPVPEIKSQPPNSLKEDLPAAADLNPEPVTPPAEPEPPKSEPEPPKSEPESSKSEPEPPKPEPESPKAEVPVKEEILPVPEAPAIPVNEVPETPKLEPISEPIPEPPQPAKEEQKIEEAPAPESEPPQPEVSKPGDKHQGLKDLLKHLEEPVEQQPTTPPQEPETPAEPQNSEKVDLPSPPTMESKNLEEEGGEERPLKLPPDILKENPDEHGNPA